MGSLSAFDKEMKNWRVKEGFDFRYLPKCEMVLIACNKIYIVTIVTKKSVKCLIALECMIKSG